MSVRKQGLKKDFAHVINLAHTNQILWQITSLSVYY